MRQATKYIDSAKIGIEFRGGQNAQENWALVDTSDATDLWFHHGDAASCHVVARIPNAALLQDKKVKHKIAVQGALLCKQWSKYKSDRDVPIMYTTMQHVTKSDRVGAVHVASFATLCV